MVGEEAITIEAAELLKSFVLDLADAFTAYLQLLADFGECVLVALAEAKAQLEHESLAGAECIERRADVALEHALAGGFV